LPKEGLSPADVKRIKKDCTIKYTNYGEKDVLVVRAYRNTENFIAVPRRYGIDLLPSLAGVLDYRDMTSAGYEAFAGIAPIKLFDYQQPWVDDMLAATEEHYDFIGKAATGKGKTVMSTEIARRLKATTLVIVDQYNLVPQWVDDTFVNLFGIPPSLIGRIQGDVCDYEEKVIVVAMLQSLIARQDTYPKEMLSHFGTVIFDEVHAISAPVYHQILCMFPAAVRFGVTATLKTGPLKKLSDLHLGKGAAVTLEQKHKKSIVRYLKSEGIYSWYANVSPKEGRFLTEIAGDTKRNLLIAKAIVWLWESERDVLVIGARIAHIENIMAMCALLGVPPEVMGQYTGSCNVWKWAKDVNPPRRPLHWEKGTEYTPVAFQSKEIKSKKPMLDEVKDNAEIVFATYSMFSKGMDVPRLSAGIDVTPRSKVQQTHGRILRSTATKKTPIWVTIRDTYSFRAEYQFGRRLHEYKASNAEVYEWRMGKGVRPVDIKELADTVEQRVKLLKQAEIVEMPDGSNTLATPDTGTDSSVSPAKRTGARHRR
jgi:superfamily II DNA or RNA helicase